MMRKDIHMRLTEDELFILTDITSFNLYAKGEFYEESEEYKDHSDMMRRLKRSEVIRASYNRERGAMSFSEEELDQFLEETEFKQEGLTAGIDPDIMGWREIETETRRSEAAGKLHKRIKRTLKKKRAPPKPRKKTTRTRKRKKKKKG